MSQEEKNILNHNQRITKYLKSKLMDAIHFRQILYLFYDLHKRYPAEIQKEIQELLKEKRKDFDDKFDKVNKEYREHLLGYGFIAKIDPFLKSSGSHKYRVVNSHYPALNPYHAKRILGLANTTITASFQFLWAPEPGEKTKYSLIKRISDSIGRAEYYKITKRGISFCKEFFESDRILTNILDIEEKILRLQNEQKIIKKEIRSILGSVSSIFVSARTALEFNRDLLEEFDQRGQYQTEEPFLFTNYKLNDSIILKKIIEDLEKLKPFGELNKEFVDLINKRLNIINAQTHIKSIKKHYESAITRLADENAQFETAKSRIRLYVPDDKKTNSMNLKCAQEIYNTAFKDDLAELLQEVTILPLNIMENEKTLYLMIVQSIQSNLQYLLNLIVRLNDKTEEIREYYSLEHVKAVNKI